MARQNSSDDGEIRSGSDLPPRRRRRPTPARRRRARSPGRLALRSPTPEERRARARSPLPRERSPLPRARSPQPAAPADDSGFTPQQLATLTNLIGANSSRGRGGGQATNRAANRGGRGGGRGRWAMLGVLHPPNNAPPQFYKLTCMAHRAAECTQCFYYTQMF